MKFSYKCPPIYKRLHDDFGVEWKDGLVITYGDTVHCIRPLTPDLVAHEQIHIDQQLAFGVEAWWDKYISDAKFRFDQEVKAYKNQAFFINVHVIDHNQRFSIKHRLAMDLSGPMYGMLCTYTEAMKLLA
jgi:hypothetical protein